MPDDIDKLASLFVLPEVSASADQILARETQQNAVEDEPTKQDSSPIVSPGAAEKMSNNIDYGSVGDSGDNQWRGNLDSDGTAFDPAIHATDDSGRPRKTKTGKWAKKRGRKSTTGYSQTATAKTSKDIEAEQAGLATAQVIFTLGVAIGGEEWQPKIDNETGLNEPHHMSQAWAEYYKATGKTDVPPWLTVVIACSCYSLPRLTMPKTQTRMQRFSKWIGGLWNARKTRKKSGD